MIIYERPAFAAQLAAHPIVRGYLDSGKLAIVLWSEIAFAAYTDSIAPSHASYDQVQSGRAHTSFAHLRR